MYLPRDVHVPARAALKEAAHLRDHPFAGAADCYLVNVMKLTRKSSEGNLHLFNISVLHAKQRPRVTHTPEGQRQHGHALPVSSAPPGGGSLATIPGVS